MSEPETPKVIDMTVGWESPEAKQRYLEALRSQAQALDSLARNLRGEE